MRKYAIGVCKKADSLKHRFKVGKERAPDAKEGRRNTSFMSYFPTVKGVPRMEGLRHYFHKNMALILDARSDVPSWTAQTEALACRCGGTAFEFTPDFTFDEGNRRRVVRLLRKGTTRSERTLERLSAVTEAYQAVGEDLMVLGEEELADGVLLSAAKALFHARLEDWHDDLPFEIAERWGPVCPTKLGSIHESQGGSQEAWRQLLSLAAFGHLRLDLTYGLDADTPVHGCDPLGYRQ